MARKVRLSCMYPANVPSGVARISPRLSPATPIRTTAHAKTHRLPRLNLDPCQRSHVPSVGFWRPLPQALELGENVLRPPCRHTTVPQCPAFDLRAVSILPQRRHVGGRLGVIRIGRGPSLGNVAMLEPVVEPAPSSLEHRRPQPGPPASALVEALRGHLAMPPGLDNVRRPQSLSIHRNPVDKIPQKQAVISGMPA